MAASTSWAATANIHATKTPSMLTRLSDKLSRFACGFSASAIMAPLYDDVELAQACTGFSSDLLMMPNRYNENESLSSSSFASSSSSRIAAAEDPPAEDKETTLPCVTFPSQHGFMVFSLTENRLRDGVVRLRRPVIGRRIVPSPYGGAVLATDLSSFRHPSRLVDPFTGESTTLPDLPVPLWYKEPSPVCEPDAPRVQGRRRAVPPTDDGFAWDRSPRGVMIARGDTVFFCEDGGGEWTTLFRSTTLSGMTVNYRGGFFFVLQQRTLVTTVIDARTLDKVADIWPPAGTGDADADAVDCVHLVASTDDVLLLVHRARDVDSELFSEVYRARHKKPKPEWRKVTDVGDRALFVDRLHGLSVGVSGEDTAGGVIKRNCVYNISATPVEDPQGRRVVVVYNVEEFRVNRPEVGRKLECRLGSSQVEQIWGEPYWMIPSSREDS